MYNRKIKLLAFFLSALLLPGISLAQTVSVASLQAELQQLLAQVAALESQIAAQGGSTASWCYTFNANLSIGMSGPSVSALQTALQKSGESVTVNGQFDDQTASAVTAFQEKYQTQILAPYGLRYGTGYAGKSTRAELNSLFRCSSSSPATPPIVVSPTSPMTPTTTAATTPPVICPAWGCNGPEPVPMPASSTTPSISITSPDSGAQWTIGDAYTVQWSAEGLNTVNLLLYEGDNCSVSALGFSVCGNVVAAQPTIPTAIAVGVSNTGSYSWAIPSSIQPGDDYRIAVQNPNSLADVVQSSGTFSIVNSGIASTSSIATSTPTISQVENLGAVKEGASVVLNWQDAIASAGIGGYNVYRTSGSTCSAGSATLIASLSSTLTYNDCGTRCIALPPFRVAKHHHVC